MASSGVPLVVRVGDDQRRRMARSVTSAAISSTGVGTG